MDKSVKKNHSAGDIILECIKELPEEHRTVLYKLINDIRVGYEWALLGQGIDPETAGRSAIGRAGAAELLFCLYGWGIIGDPPRRIHLSQNEQTWTAAPYALRHDVPPGWYDYKNVAKRRREARANEKILS